jgi:hypothetical protein
MSWWGFLTWLGIGIAAGATIIFAYRLLRKVRRDEYEWGEFIRSEAEPEVASAWAGSDQEVARRNAGRGRPTPTEGVSTMRRITRAVGYCESTECEDYAKGVFLLNHGDTFYCPRCREEGTIIKEEGRCAGNSDIFKEVRVEYNYDPIRRAYRELAIVRDEALWGMHNVYTLQSPLIKTDKRAAKVAEALLGNLSRPQGLLAATDGNVPRTTEYILDLDKPPEEFSRDLEDFANGLRGGGLARREEGR